MPYDVVIAGGGPAGLSAALTLGRARKSVLLCDAGPRRNAAAEHIQSFVTRDGVTPTEFRRVASRTAISRWSCPGNLSTMPTGDLAVLARQPQ